LEELLPVVGEEW